MTLLRSKEHAGDKKANIVMTYEGGKPVLNELLSLKVYDNENRAYTIGELLELIITLTAENKRLRDEYNTLKDDITNKADAVIDGHEAVAAKLAEMEYDLEQVKKALYIK